MSDSTEWVSQLLLRHANVLAHQPTPTPDALKTLNSLQLADAVLDKSSLSSSHPEHALQIAIIGPTQSGKSTLVNLLLDTQAAAISALAGFTVHAQGYASGYSEAELQELTAMMEPLKRVPASSLAPTELDTYVLESVESGDAALLKPAVVWDTPDFDSIDAGAYKQAVMNTIAISDFIVLMVSKDKYGDKSVWDILHLIQPLRRPLVVCINKLDAQDEQAVLQAFSKRFTDRFAEASLPPIILLPFVRRLTPGQEVTLPVERMQQLHKALNDTLQQVDRQAARQSAQAFMENHKEQWLEPLVHEQRAANQWTELVDEAMDRAQDQYARDYLNNPDKYDTFKRALAELLTLLELPGIAPVLMRTRQVVTWPARKLFGLGRDAYDRQFDKDSRTPADLEADALERILDATLISLQGSLLDQPQESFWNAMVQAFRQREPEIRRIFLERSEAVREEFNPEVEAAAQRLYKQLQSQPRLLNTLRATRVTADAAGVALALKSGGIAPADLVLAPAMLSVTTLLTESALGKYLDTIKAELKERQRQHINSRLLQGVLKQELMQLSNTLPEDKLFAQQLEPELREALAESV